MEETMNRFNATVRNNKSNKVTNPEGYKTYKRRVDQDLFLQACSFTPRNSFYHTDLERLEMLTSLIKKNDKEYVEALAWYLGKVLGIRLSPSIITTELALENPNWKAIEKIAKDVFTRPDFLANSLGYLKLKTKGNSFTKKLPVEFKLILKKQLESFGDLTLKRQKMRRKAIKLADLIKTLKPKPKNIEMSKLYKAIIENDKSASLKTEVSEDGKIISSEHVTAAISSDKISHSEKKEFVQKNISNIPINALVKNLSFVEAKDAAVLEKRLSAVFESGDGLRFINPFDLIMLPSSEWEEYTGGVRVDSEITLILDRILKKYVQVDVDAKHPLILYDNSGSMSGEPHRNGIKFVSSFGKMFEGDFNFYTFNYNEKNITSDIMDLDFNNPNIFARELQKLIYCNGGTALLQSMKNVLEIHPETDLFVIVTDESTWADPKQIDAYKRVLPEHLMGKTILFNANPGVGSVFKPGADVTRLAGLSGRILSILKAISNFDSFKREMIAEFKSAK